MFALALFSYYCLRLVGRREREREREREIRARELLRCTVDYCCEWQANCFSLSVFFFLGFEWFGPDTQERHHGVLFNETPPPPKQKMKWEDWELPYYAIGIMAVLLLAVGLSAKRDTRIETWARKQALERPR